MLSGSFVRLVSEIVGSKVGLRLHEALTNILLIHNPIAVVNRIGLVAGNLLGCLSGDTGAIHVPHCRAPRIMKEASRPSSFLPCRPLGTIIMLNPLPLPVKDVQTGFYTLHLPAGNNICNLPDDDQHPPVLVLCNLLMLTEFVVIVSDLP